MSDLFYDCCRDVYNVLSEATVALLEDNAKEMASACSVFARKEEDRLNEKERAKYLSVFDGFIGKFAFLEELKNKIILAEILNKGNEEVIDLLKELNGIVNNLEGFYKLFVKAYKEMCDKNRAKDYANGANSALGLKANLRKLTELM